MALDISSVSAAEFGEWMRAARFGFLRLAEPTEDEVKQRSKYTDLSRTRGAFENGRCVATFRSFDQEVTAVGGASIRANAVSAVTVSPTHRRRGLLSRMMAIDLDAAKERGDSIATLIAAEYPIYGRFGFGPAASSAEWLIDVPRTGLDPHWSSRRGEGSIEFISAGEVRRLGPELYERFRAFQPGAVNRDEWWWLLNTGKVLDTSQPWKEPFYALYRGTDGQTEGLITYTVDDKWGDAKQPLNTATVRDMFATSPAAERALWYFVCSVDWIMTVRTGLRAPDDILPHVFPDPRAARIVTLSDYLWVRILDVSNALTSRAYQCSGSLVLEVRDVRGYANGRVQLDVSPEGAQCHPTTLGADLTLDVTDLGALWLGEESVTRLRALGRIDEERSGAVTRADSLLATARRPWCPDEF